MHLFLVGEDDFPARLLPPSRLIGRDDHVADLEGAFRDGGEAPSAHGAVPPVGARQPA
jgi:hypothetical protein